MYIFRSEQVIKLINALVSLKKRMAIDLASSKCHWIIYSVWDAMLGRYQKRQMGRQLLPTDRITKPLGVCYGFAVMFNLIF